MNEEVHEIKEACLKAMKEVCDKYADEAEKAGYDRNEFGMIVLEQWRPW